MQNYSRRIQEAEDAYQAEVNRKTEEDNKKDGGSGTPSSTTSTPVRVARNKPLSFRQVTNNKIYTIETEEDIDKVLAELREVLKAQLEDDTIIRLS